MKPILRSPNRKVDQQLEIPFLLDKLHVYTSPLVVFTLFNVTTLLKREWEKLPKEPRNFVLTYLNLSTNNIPKNYETPTFILWVTLRSYYRIVIDFDKICVFCGKYCVHNDKCVFIVVKIKNVNSGIINDICEKLDFTTNYIHFIKTHINITILDTFDKTVRRRT